jgi:hypothetical protein
VVIGASQKNVLRIESVAPGLIFFVELFVDYYSLSLLPKARPGLILTLRMQLFGMNTLGILRDYLELQ